MRFRLAALGDCPDFILGEVHALSQLHVGQARALTEEAARVMTGTRAQVDTHALAALIRIDAPSVEGHLAAITYLLTNGVKHCDYYSSAATTATLAPSDNSTFLLELQQLGMPQEHAVTMTRVFEEYRPALRALFKRRTMRVGHQLKQVAVKSTTGGDIELCLSTLSGDDNAHIEEHVLDMDRAELRVLLDELRTARNILTRYCE